MTRMTIKALQKLRDDGVKIAVLTCYDASFAAMLDAAGDPEQEGGGRAEGAGGRGRRRTVRGATPARRGQPPRPRAAGQRRGVASAPGGCSRLGLRADKLAISRGKNRTSPRQPRQAL